MDLREILKKTGKEFTLYIPAKLLPALTGIITIPIYTRLFPPREYGLFSVAMATVSFLAILSTNWLRASVLRFLPHYQATNKEDSFFSSLFGTLFIFLPLLLLISLLILYLLKGIFTSRLFYLLQLSLFIAVATTLYNILISIFRARQQAKKFAVFEVSNSYIGIGIGLSLVLVLNFDISGLLWGFLVTLLVADILLIFIFAREKVLILRKFSKPVVQEFMSYGIVLTLSGLAGWILTTSDRYIVQLFRGSKEVGLYSIGYALSDKGIYLIIAAFTLASTPALVNSWEKYGKELTISLLKQLTRYLIILTLPAVVGISILAKPILQVLTTKAYHDSHQVVLFVSSGTLLFGLYLLAYTGLYLHKKTRLIAANIILAGLLNIVLNSILVPHYGFIAAAVTTFVSYAFLLTTTSFMVGKYLPWKFPLKSLLKVVIASTILGVALHFSKQLFPVNIISLLIQVIVGAISYFAILLVLGTFGKDEINQVLEWLRIPSGNVNI